MPCVGTNWPGGPERQCRRCFYVKRACDLTPGMAWARHQMCNAHNKAAYQREKGFLPLVTALQAACKAISGGKLEACFLYQCPVCTHDTARPLITMFWEFSQRISPLKEYTHLHALHSFTLDILLGSALVTVPIGIDCAHVS